MQPIMLTCSISMSKCKIIMLTCDLNFVACQHNYVAHVIINKLRDNIIILHVKIIYLAFRGHI